MILPDRLRPGLDIVFCGTAAGPVSAKRGLYYAGPGNRFWPLLAETGLTPRRLMPEDDHLLPDFGLGLTDLAKTASGTDAKIPAQAYDPEGLMQKINQYRPRALAFTSLTAARLALGNTDLRSGLQPADARLPGLGIWALPSPSGSARGHFQLGPWQALADWRRG